MKDFEYYLEMAIAPKQYKQPDFSELAKQIEEHVDSEIEKYDSEQAKQISISLKKFKNKVNIRDNRDAVEQILMNKYKKTGWYMAYITPNNSGSYDFVLIKK